MSDLISRKAVMDWLRELQAQSIINENHGTLVDATISTTVNHFINFIVQVPTAYDADKVVEKLEHEAQQSDIWIPITEETNPNKSDAYLVTFEERGKMFVDRFYYSYFSGWMMPVNWQDEGHIDKLIAWKPLPTPYKEDSSETNII